MTSLEFILRSDNKVTYEFMYHKFMMLKILLFNDGRCSELKSVKKYWTAMEKCNQLHNCQKATRYHHFR